MYNYDRLWDTMAQKGMTKYKLVKDHGISKSLLHRLKNNQSVSMNTLDTICNILDCDIEDVVTHVRDSKD